MSQMRRVSQLVKERGEATADDILPDCVGMTRAQVMQAMQNAAHKGWIVVKEVRYKPGFGNGRLPYVYGPGELPEPKKKMPFGSRRPPASVWELGTI